MFLCCLPWFGCEWCQADDTSTSIGAAPQSILLAPLLVPGAPTNPLGVCVSPLGEHGARLAFLAPEAPSPFSPGARRRANTTTCS